LASIVMLGDVRFGSKADICSAMDHVCFTPESGHGTVFPLAANGRKDVIYFGSVSK